mgnify:CR=1 FL=1
MRILDDISSYVFDYVAIRLRKFDELPLKLFTEAFDAIIYYLMSTNGIRSGFGKI